MEVGVPGLGDVHEDVGVRELLERRAERRDERRRELVDEADRVGEQDRDAARERRAPGRGIERRERLVGDEHVGVRERVEQRGLAGVRVAGERREEETLAGARPTRALALARDLGEPLLQVLDALPDDLTVALELALAGAAGPDAAAQPRHLLAAAGQTRQPVFELRELHLDATLARARVAREDVEDHPGAVHDGDVRRLLERPLLRRRELVVRHDDVRAQPRDLAADLLGLALPHPGVPVGRPAVLDHTPGDDAASRLDQRGELLERVGGREGGRGKVERDEIGALGGRLRVDHAAATRIAFSGSSDVGSNHRIAGSRLNQVI